MQYNKTQKVNVTNVEKIKRATEIHLSRFQTAFEDPSKAPFTNQIHLLKTPRRHRKFPECEATCRAVLRTVPTHPFPPPIPCSQTLYAQIQNLQNPQNKTKQNHINSNNYYEYDK